EGLRPGRVGQADRAAAPLRLAPELDQHRPQLLARRSLLPRRRRGGRGGRLSRLHRDERHRHLATAPVCLELRHVPAHPRGQHGSGRRLLGRRHRHGRRGALPRGPRSQDPRLRPRGLEGRTLDMSEARLTIVLEGTETFEQLLAQLSRRGETDLDRVEPAVREILSAVRSEGDAAVRRYVERFENRTPGASLLIRDYGGAEALAALPKDLAEALRIAAERIRDYHQHQAEQQKTFAYEKDGVRLASRVTPLARVGIYAPGGKACYPSSVLMCAVPAAVAGVEEIYLASPDTSLE